MIKVADSDDPKPLQNSRSVLRIGFIEDPSPSLSETLPDSVNTVVVYDENQPPPASCPGWISVDAQEFVCDACGEQKVKGPVAVCDGCKGLFDLECAEMWGWEAKNVGKWICRKCISREAKGEGLDDLRQNVVAGGHAEVDTCGDSNKRMKMVEDGNLKPWSNLPEDLLGLITRHFGVVDYLLFGCVCRSWKLYASAYKQEFMASQAPLILLLSPRARKSCYFYNLFERKMYMALLPSLVGRYCAGITGGYLVMDNKNEKADDPLWLVNPITRHELYFPRSPNLLDRIFLVSVPKPRGEFMLIGFSMIPPVLLFCRTGDVQWTNYEIQDHDFGLPIDGAFFKGKLYFLNHVGRIFQFDPSSPPYFIKLGVESIPNPTLIMRLLASDEQLFVIVTSIPEYYRVYMLNFPMKLWTTVHSLGDQALFIGCQYHVSTSGSCMNIKSEEGCQWARNCILDVGYRCTEKFTLHHLDGKFHIHIKIEPRNGVPTSSMNRAFWYFPHLACKVNILSQ